MAHIAIASASTSASIPHNKETSRTSTLIPEQLVNKAQGLIKLLKDYYDYLNSEGLPSFEVNRIVDNHDIDRISAKYLDSIADEIAKNVPNSKVLDRVSLYKKIVKFYSIRGSEDSLYTFFRIFFDEVATVTYPKERLFKLSDGDWNTNTNNEEIELIGNLLRGKLNDEAINTTFQVQNASGDTLGEGQLSNYVNVDKSFDYDNVTDDMVMGFDSKQNITDTNWISITDYPWIGTLQNGVEYQEETKDLRFDGINDYIDVGTLGDDSFITDEHTIVVRARREDIGGNNRQSIFEIMERSSQTIPTSIKLSNVQIQSGPNTGDPWAQFNGDYIYHSNTDDYRKTYVINGTTYINRIYYDNDRWKFDYGSITTFELSPFISKEQGFWSTEGTNLWSGAPGYHEAFNSSAVGGGPDWEIVEVGEGTSGDVFEAHSLYVDRDTGKIGRYWIDNHNPMIVGTVFATMDVLLIRDFDFPTGFLGTDTNTYFYKNTAYDNNTGLYNGKPFYTDINVYYTGPNGDRISPQQTWLFDENSGFGVPGNWPCATIYYDGNKWIFKGAREYILDVGDGPVEGVIASFSENTSEDVFTANIEWFGHNAFVNTPTLSGFISSENTTIPANGKYYTIAITGKRARKGGYIKVSIDGSNWETIVSGDTTTHLNITKYTPINIGGGRSDSSHFKGTLTNIQYYNRSLTESEIIQITNYYLGVAYNFYQIQFSNQDGSFISGSTLVEKTNELYTLNLLTGHEVEAVWIYDEPTLDESGFGPTIAITPTYSTAISADKQKIRWGDFNSDLFTSGNTIQHTYTTKNVGYYDDRRGFVSDVNRLHDGDFWQEFSYIINVGLSSDQWENEFVRMVHPAGLKFFAAVLYVLSVDNNWIGPNVKFDQSMRKYISTYDEITYAGNYRTNDPLVDLRWMEGLTPPSLLNANAKAHHTPLFQPGWLTGDLRFLELIIEALEFDLGPNNPAYQRIVLSTLHLLHITTKDRNAFAREDYLNNLKFLDSEIITPYLNIIFEEAVFNDPTIFNNIGAFIDIGLIQNLRLNTEDDEDIQTEDDDYLIKE